MEEFNAEMDRMMNEALFHSTFGDHKLPRFNDAWAEISGPNVENRALLCKIGKCERDYMPAIEKDVCVYCLSVVDHVLPDAPESEKEQAEKHSAHNSSDPAKSQSTMVTDGHNVKQEFLSPALKCLPPAGETTVNPQAQGDDKKESASEMDTDTECGDPEEILFQTKGKQAKKNIAGSVSGDGDESEIEDDGEDEEMEEAGYPGSDPDDSRKSDSGHSFPSVDSDREFSFYV